MVLRGVSCFGPSVPLGERLLAVLAGVLLLLASLPAAADSLADLVCHAAPGSTVVLPPEGAIGRADISGKLTLAGSAGANARLSAPADEAIVVVVAGAEVTLRDVVLAQEQSTRFGIYVDGGTLVLERCVFEGPFETALMVASGRVSLVDCAFKDPRQGIVASAGAEIKVEGVAIERAADIAILADGARLALKELRLAGGAKAGIQVQNGSVVEMSASAIDGAGSNERGFLAIGAAAVAMRDIAFSGSGGGALWFDKVPKAELSGIVVERGWDSGLTAVNGGRLSMAGFSIAGRSHALLVEGYGEAVSLAHGEAIGEAGGLAAAMTRAANLEISDVDFIGGDVGLQIANSPAGTHLSRITARGQARVGLFLEGDPNQPSTAPVVIDEPRIIETGKALPIFARNTGDARIERGVFLAAGPLAFASEASEGLVLSGNAFVTAPYEVLGQRAVRIEGEAELRFLDTGPLAAVDQAAAPAGNLALSPADFATLPGLAPELRRAAADFAVGAETSSALLALALEEAQFAARAPASQSVPRHSVMLAPPESGWQWDAEAAQIRLVGPDGTAIDAHPRDFPLELAEGSYQVRVDGRQAGRLRVTGPTELHLPLPLAPFYAWRTEDGVKVRGPTLYLRPKSELKALLEGLRPLLPGEFWGYDTIFAPRRGTNRAEASAVLAKAREAIPAELAAESEHRAAERWAEADLRWQTVDAYLDVFAAFGTAEDAAWLLDLPIPARVNTRNQEAAVLIETRLGLLAEGRALAAARAGLAGFDSADPAAREALGRLLVAIARQGLSEGHSLLAEYYRRTEAAAGPGSLTWQGMIELSQLDPIAAGDLPTAYLDKLEATLGVYLSGGLPQDSPNPIWTGHWIAAAMALAHEAAYGVGKAADRRLPISVEAYAGEISWLFDEPAVFLGGRFANAGPADPYKYYAWNTEAGMFICPALALRTPERRATIIAKARAEIEQAVLRDGVPNFPELSAEKQAETVSDISVGLNYSLGECLLSEAIVQHFGRDAAGEEAAFFENLDYEPLWWVRRPRAQAVMASFGRGEPYPRLDGLGPYSAELLLAALGPDEKADPALLDAAMARHRLTTDGFMAPAGFFTFGSERRQFRLRNSEGNGSITIAGYLDIRPLPDDARLIVAIHHNILSPDLDAGLAAAIRSGDRAVYEANSRIGMFESIVLDRGGEETPMTHAGTGRDGVLYFTAPWNGSLDDLTLHIDMRFMDATWEMAVPLWASDLAHDLRLNASQSRSRP